MVKMLKCKCRKPKLRAMSRSSATGLSQGRQHINTKCVKCGKIFTISGQPNR